MTYEDLTPRIPALDDAFPKLGDLAAYALALEVGRIGVRLGHSATLSGTLATLRRWLYEGS